MGDNSKAHPSVSQEMRGVLTVPPSTFLRKFVWNSVQTPHFCVTFNTRESGNAHPNNKLCPLCLFCGYGGVLLLAGLFYFPNRATERLDFPCGMEVPWGNSLQGRKGGISGWLPLPGGWHVRPRPEEGSCSDHSPLQSPAVAQPRKGEGYYRLVSCLVVAWLYASRVADSRITQKMLLLL